MYGNVDLKWMNQFAKRTGKSKRKKVKSEMKKTKLNKRCRSDSL